MLKERPVTSLGDANLINSGGAESLLPGIGRMIWRVHPWRVFKRFKDPDYRGSMLASQLTVQKQTRNNLSTRLGKRLSKGYRIEIEEFHQAWLWPAEGSCSSLLGMLTSIDPFNRCWMRMLCNVSRTFTYSTWEPSLKGITISRIFKPASGPEVLARQIAVWMTNTLTALVNWNQFDCSE